MEATNGLASTDPSFVKAPVQYAQVYASGAPITVSIAVSNFVASQSGTGQAINGSFSVAATGTTVGLVRVHAGSTFDGSTCYTDLIAGTGSKSFSFSGSWTNQSGQTCSTLLPAIGASKPVYFKVEATNGLASTAAGYVKAPVQYAQATYSR